jgi:hypothetical protein
MTAEEREVAFSEMACQLHGITPAAQLRRIRAGRPAWRAALLARDPAEDAAEEAALREVAARLTYRWPGVTPALLRWLLDGPSDPACGSLP